MNKLNEFQLGNIAGFMDGEGNIALEERPRNRTHYYVSQINVTNTNKQALEKLQLITGIGTIYQTRKDHEIWKDSWIWSIETKDQKEFLTTILPYLRSKNEKAKALIEYLDLPINRKGEIVPDHIKISRRVLTSELSELNKRGYTSDSSTPTESPYCKNRTLTDDQLGWITAIVDGEGTLSIKRVRTRNTYVYKTNLTVTNTCIKILECLELYTGLGVFYKKKLVENQKQAWIWALRTHEIQDFLLKISSSLLIKYEQSRVLLEFLSLNSKRGKQVSYETKVLQGALYLECFDLNRRGKDAIVS